MSRYQVQKYVDCDKNEFNDTINWYKKRGFEIEKRQGAVGYFVVAKEYGNEIYIAFEEYDIKQCKIWHERLPKEECKKCEIMDCEIKKEVNQA